MDQEELLLVVRRSFEKVKSDIKTHDAYIQALRAEIELLKMHLQRLAEKTEQTQRNEVLHIPSRRNKLYSKQKIIETLSAGSRPLVELKEIVVDTEHCCSKASFYRYIEELRLSGNLLLVETDGVFFVSRSVHATK